MGNLLLLPGSLISIPYNIITYSFRTLHPTTQSVMGSIGSKDPPLPKEIRLKIEEIRKDKRAKKPGEQIRRMMSAGKAIAKEVESLDKEIADVRFLITLNLTKAADAGSPANQLRYRKVKGLLAERTKLIDRAFSNTADSDRGVAGSPT